MRHTVLAALAATALLAAVGGPLLGQKCGVGEVEAAWCGRPPVIDGFEDDDEWGEAPSVDLAFDLIRVQDLMAGQLGVTESKSGSLYVMNDDETLYLAVRILDIPANEQVNEQTGEVKVDIFATEIDVDGGGLTSIGDDQKVVLTVPDGGMYMDQHRTKMEGGDEHTDDPVQDGRGQVRHSEGEGAGEYFVEFSMPLDSGDERDFAALPGEELRLSILFVQAFSSPTMEQARVGFVLSRPLPEAFAGAGLYGRLTLAAGP